MPTILIFPGSLRQDSHNRQLAQHIAARLPADMSVDWLQPGQHELPLFNQDDELDAQVLAQVLPLYQRCLQADGLIVLSPEYNGGISPYLKNTMDWISRLPHLQALAAPLYHKPVLLGCATGGGSGGALGLRSARELFSYLGCLVLPEQISLAYAAEAWDEGGEIYHGYFAAQLEVKLQAYCSLLRRLAPCAEAA